MSTSAKICSVIQKHPQYSMSSSERPSAEPILKKKKRGVPSRTEGEIILEMLWKPQMPGNALRAFPGSFQNFFRNFFRKVPAVLRVWPSYVVYNLR